MSFKLDDDYVDVATRIQKFYATYEHGRLGRLGDPTIMPMGDRLFVAYTAVAYRAPDDPVPAIGTAWEPFPGPTQFTRDSELMNAETAAWGRAIIAAGIPSKNIASRNEVQARQPGTGGPPFGPAVNEAQGGQLRRAIAYVLDVADDSRTIDGVIEGISRKAGADNYVPVIAMQAIGLLAAAVKERNEEIAAFTTNAREETNP